MKSTIKSQVGYRAGSFYKIIPSAATFPLPKLYVMDLFLNTGLKNMLYRSVNQ